VTGLRDDIREVLITSVNDAQPDHKALFPEPSIWPFVTAIATTGLFIGSIFTPWAVPIGAIPLAAALIGWFWPKKLEPDERPEPRLA
jgi:cytochrome c oxidase subunit I+III